MDIKNDFQPIPKRFIVWDTLHREWVVPYDYEGENAPYIYNMYELMCRLNLTKIGVKDGQYVIFQSTNLFDKYGEEIFEGGIIEDAFNETLGYVYYESKACAWRVKFNDGEEDDGWTLENSANVLKNIGHVLPDLELLEEKNV